MSRARHAPARIGAPGPDISYQLLIVLREPVSLDIGALGRRVLPAGHYRYTGSARRNLEARIARHLRREKTVRWHIDYLLLAAAAHVDTVLRSAQPECAWNAATPGELLLPGFGASDCRAGCGSHLKYQGPLNACTRVVR